MFGLSFTHILVLAVIALIFIGPDQLPEVARTLGRFLNDLKRSTESLSDDIKQRVNLDLEEKRNDLRNIAAKETEVSNHIHPVESQNQLELTEQTPTVEEKHKEEKL